MGSERRMVIYGRYFQDEEAVIGNLNEIPGNIENARTAASGYSRQNYRAGTLSNNSQQANPFDFCPDQPIHQGIYVNSINHSHGMHAGPASASHIQNHIYEELIPVETHGLRHQQTFSRHATYKDVGVSNHYQNCIPNSSSNRPNPYRFGGLTGNLQADPIEMCHQQTFIHHTAHGNRHGASNIDRDYNRNSIPGLSSVSNQHIHSGINDNLQDDPFEMRHQQTFSRHTAHGNIGARNVDRYNQDSIPGPSSTSNRHIHRGMNGNLPADPFELNHQQTVNHHTAHGNLGASIIDHYNQNNIPGPSSASNRHIHRGMNGNLPADPFEMFHQQTFNRHTANGSLGSSNIDDYNQDGIPGPSCASNRHSHRRMIINQESADPFGMRHQQTFSRHAAPGECANNINHRNQNYMSESNSEPNKRDVCGYGELFANKQPENIGDLNFPDIERYKLIARIKNIYEENARSVFEKNLQKFEKEDWLQVSYVSCEGLKIYQAEMICPICFGKVTPQNREKEAGMLPKWELASVKRHVIAIHSELRTKDGRVLGKKKKLQQKEYNDIEHSDGEESKMKTQSHVEKIDHSTKMMKKTGESEKTDANVKLVEEKPLYQEDKPLDDNDESSKKSEELHSGETNHSSDESSSESSESSSSSSSSSSSDTSCESDHIDTKNECKRTTRKTKAKGVREEETKNPDWKNPNVFFGWVKLTKSSRFQPAFIYPREKRTGKHTAKYIETNGTLSDSKHPVEVIGTLTEVERAKESKKSHKYLKAIQLFNSENSTKF